MRKAIAVVGEGITEKYYIESLKGLSPFNIEPRALGQRASSLKDLEKSIKKSIDQGYDEVYCLIDMDGKQEGKSKEDYTRLKNVYHDKIHGRKKDGIQCKVMFIETDRCTELWFLFHFKYTTKNYSSYKELEKDLREYRPNYDKSEKYFRSVNLHKDFTNKDVGGSFGNAISNGKKSIGSMQSDGRRHTYTEIHILLEALSII